MAFADGTATCRSSRHWHARSRHFSSDAPNAFATGWNRNNALVAVSTGMLQRFKPEEVRAVMAHEIGHVANGDMVTLTLIQGVLTPL